jgi:hypothetical protein
LLLTIKHQPPSCGIRSPERANHILNQGIQQWTRYRDILSDRPSVVTWLWLWAGPLCSWGIWVRGPGPPGWWSLRWDTWLWVLSDSNQCVIALQITDSSSRQRGRPAWRRKKVIVKQRQLKSGRTQRRTGRLTVGRNITWTWTSHECSARGHNWATLFLGDVNIGNWPSRFGESQMRQLYYVYGYGSGATLIIVWLHCKLQTRPLVRKGATWRREVIVTQRNKKSGNLPQRGPRHQDKLPDWPSVTIELEFDIPVTLTRTRCLRV